VQVSRSKYNPITENERYQIWSDLKAGFSVSQITENLGRSKSSIYPDIPVIPENTGISLF